MDTLGFSNYLEKEKKVSENTVSAYVRDVIHFEKFMLERGIKNLEETSNPDVVSYLISLKANEMSKSTANRKLASIRTYFTYLVHTGKIDENPTDEIKTPKIDRKEVEYISIEEMDKVLSMPDKTEKGIRDRAILELLYATGIRATELIDMKLEDCNLRMGFVKCIGENVKSRIVPIGRLARKAMEDYVLDVRSKMLKGHESEILFVNYAGEKMTRQGLWKVIKEYGEMAELKVSLTPQVIRNSFAVHMLQNGADLKSLQDLMGHEDIAATQVYLSVTKNKIKDVYDRTHPRA